MENLKSYREIADDFNQEARKEDGMFSKETECDRLSIAWLREIVYSDMHALEIGCGMGKVIKALGCYQYGIDISKEMIERCGGDFIVGNMDELPYEKNKFDIVYMIMTLQQSLDVKKTLSEMKRVTKKGGRMIIIDGDKDSGIGKERETKMKEGTWETCGQAKWLSAKQFKGWEIDHLAPHIIIINKTK